MSAWRTALAGALALAVLDAAVSSTEAAGRVGGLMKAVAKVVEHALSPTVAAIPDLRKHGGSLLQAIPPDDGSGSLVPPDWNTSPTAPPTTPPSQLYA